MLEMLRRLLGRDSNAALFHAYRPIIRGYFLVAAIYYGAMTVLHAVDLSGARLATMSGLSLLAFAASAIALYLSRKSMSVVMFEVLISTVNLLLLLNVLAALEIAFNPAKVVYFVILAVIFAFASISLRQALASLVVNFAVMIVELSTKAPQDVVAYAFVAFAAALSSFSIAIYLRRAVRNAVTERLDAERAKARAERRLVEAERVGATMREQSLSDSLTGLPNRRALFQQLADMQSGLTQGSGLWLMLLDLDGFKAVNDTYGHIIGDELLRGVSGRLQEHCGNQAVACRIGGDEFGLLSASGQPAAEMEQWCQSLLASLAEAYLIEERMVRISASIGCYRISDAESESSALRNADFALLEAKRNGKNRVVLFREDHARQARERFRIEKALRMANFDQEIELVFQPQFDLRDEGCVRAEALARWNSPHIGKVSPDQFIRIAEESGLIARITLAVIDKAIGVIEGWDDPLPLSVNLSGNDLLSDQIVGEILKRLDDSGMEAHLLEFEVTETAMMPDLERATANLRRLSERGHPIALDDFGTGYSNFTRLRALPINKLKVDRSFMENLADPMTERVLKSLVGMARTLNVPCLLEGIETELELLVAKRVGAHAAQGFLFGYPLDAAAIGALVEAGELSAGLANASASPVRSHRAG